jgi:hypothetical protein
MMDQIVGPVRSIPRALHSAFTMEGKIPVIEQYFDESVSHEIVWSYNYVQSFIDRFTVDKINREEQGEEPYPGTSLLVIECLKKYSPRGKTIAVVGSQTPWLEAILINNGALSVTTIEYNVPKSEHPSIKTDSFEAFSTGEKMYDLIVSFSSIEHSGLGRYGDILDPDGDLKTMRTLRNHLLREGLLLWGAPVGRDVLVWNAHRIYGKKRIALVFQGFKEKERFSERNRLATAWRSVRVSAKSVLKGKGRRYDLFDQPLVVLKKVS